jgi:hypothetical protein
MAREVTTVSNKPRKRGLFLTKDEHELLLYFLEGSTNPESGMMGGNPEFKPVLKRIKKMFD